MPTQPGKFIRWLDRVADFESRATNGLLWFMILACLSVGVLTVAVFSDQGFMHLAAGFAALSVALFPLENRFSERATFPTMSVVPHDAHEQGVTYGSYAYYDAKSEEIPLRVIQYRQYNRAKFLHFPLGLFACLSASWVPYVIL